MSKNNKKSNIIKKIVLPGFATLAKGIWNV
jgi:hypothetical protein